MDLNLTESTAGSLRIIEVRGEVDLHSAPRLRDCLVAAIDAGYPSVIVDLSEMDFIDSTGLGALVAGRNLADQSNVSLIIVCAVGRILKLFRITGLDQIFMIFQTRSAAVESQGG